MMINDQKSFKMFKNLMIISVILNKVKNLNKIIIQKNKIRFILILLINRNYNINK